jgi:hypothetical protein
VLLRGSLLPQLDWAAGGVGGWGMPLSLILS